MTLAACEKGRRRYEILRMGLDVARGAGRVGAGPVLEGGTLPGCVRGGSVIVGAGGFCAG